MKYNKGVFVDNKPDGFDLLWDTEGDADTEANPVQNNPARPVFHMASEPFPPAPGAHAPRPPPLLLALLYYSFSDLIWFNSGLHRFNLSMKNALWHFIWLLRMCSGWPSFLMKLFKARHYWHRLNIWDRLGVCNKLCCTVPPDKIDA